MSDVEEPAAKMSKLDHQEEEEMEDGQEEWLSEEILTDEEYNTAPGGEQDDSNANTSKEEGNSMEQPETNDSVEQAAEEAKTSMEENIEETLNNFENSMSNDQNDLPKDLGTFLVKNPDGQQETKTKGDKEESDLDESVKQSDDDGNDTDDLLRMLGEDNSKKKESTSSKPTQVNDNQHSSDDDDDYIFEGAKVTRLKVSKDVLMNSEKQVKRLKVAKGALMPTKAPTKAAPEDVSDKEADNQTSTKMKNFKSVALLRKPVPKAVPEEFSDGEEDSIPGNVKSTSSKRASAASSDEATTMKRIFGMRGGKVAKAGQRARPLRPANGINAVKTVTKRVVSIDSKPVPAALIKQESKPVVTLTRFKPREVKQETTKEPLDDEPLDEESQDQESDLEMESEGGQRLMRPERMDEEIPSDAESVSDGDSYYDELPSSESEDTEDWFTLDLRTERAADYLPMLGTNAHALLKAEQQRALRRLSTLRQSARALCAGRRALASQLRLARHELAQLDAALTAH